MRFQQQSYRTLLFCVMFAVCLTATKAHSQSEWEKTYQLKHIPGPVDNPLKGLVPYARPHPDRFPHSMEFMYLALSDLMKSESELDWTPLEELLDDIASRGNQAVVRIYVEYPGKKKGIPQYLVEEGLEVHEYENTNTAPFPPENVRTPDYEDEKLHRAFRLFIAAWGKRYDGDPRLGYITAGLLGTWGEWHTYPRDDLWASKRTQRIVLDAYEKAFKRTPVLLRYPATENHYAQVENASRPFGYHDDSFAWATLDTGRREDDWFYLPALKAAGKDAIEKWKTQPIGGEIRPEVWGKIFDTKDQWPKQAQDFHQCVSETHATWLMDTGMFRETAKPDRFKRAIKEVRRLGYDLHVESVNFRSLQKRTETSIEMDVINHGVAPFYAEWPTEIALLDSAGKIVRRSIEENLSIRGLLPGSQPTRLKTQIDTQGLSGTVSILMRVVNPLPNGKTLRFANVEQDQERPGWLSLGQVTL